MSTTDEVSATFYALRLVRHNNPILKFLLYPTEDSNVALSKDKNYPTELNEALGIIREVQRERSVATNPLVEEEPDWLQRALSERIIQLAMKDISIEDYDADAGERILFYLRHQDQNAYGASIANRDELAATFEVGDRVVYGEYGLGTIESIARSQEQGESSFHYLILLDESQESIPVSSITAFKEGLRRPWSPQDCKNFLENLRLGFSLDSDPAYICSSLTYAIISGDIVRVSSVLKEFCYIARFNKIARYESSFLNESIERIAQEIMFSLNLLKVEVMRLLESALNESIQHKNDEVEKLRATQQELKRVELEKRELKRLELEKRELRRLELEKLKLEGRRKSDTA
ncbi:MAG: hypothetical protein QOG71_3864 [Pyrinomonadaceae bacterium]|nr:hypothetical protein [Pyrinomonadaceae bacterium]